MSDDKNKRGSQDRKSVGNSADKVREHFKNRKGGQGGQGGQQER